MTLAAQVFDHRAAARGITFSAREATERHIPQFIVIKGQYQVISGAYHPIVWYARDYFIGPARISNDWK